ncbi:MAG: acyl-CoA thioester hydrolase [Francisellaceae bacterium]|jgi:acyl-CoA thioester hydrolase
MAVIPVRIQKSIISNCIDIEVPFFDVDAMEITWHGNYIKYFEISRCALLEKIQYDYAQMKESGYGWPVIDLRVKYVRPSRFKQIITVQSDLIEFENRLKINYIIKDKKSGEKLTTGYSTQVAIDLKTKEMCFVSPKILLDKMKEYV